MTCRKVAPVLLVAVLLLMPGICLADWQPQQNNGYTWYVDGDNKAFPIETHVGTTDWYVQYTYPGQGVMYITPVPNADPRLDTYSYTFVNTATNEIWTRQDNQQWSYVSNPDLTGYKNYRDYWYNAYISNTGKPADAYYQAKYSEADTLFRVSKAIALKNG